MQPSALDKSFRSAKVTSASWDELTRKFFARAAGVENRRVDEVSACVAVSLVDFLRFGLR